MNQPPASVVVHRLQTESALQVTNEIQHVKSNQCYRTTLEIN